MPEALGVAILCASGKAGWCDTKQLMLTSLQKASNLGIHKGLRQTLAKAIPRQVSYTDSGMIRRLYDRTNYNYRTTGTPGGLGYPVFAQRLLLPEALGDIHARETTTRTLRG